MVTEKIKRRAAQFRQEAHDLASSVHVSDGDWEYFEKLIETAMLLERLADLADAPLRHFETDTERFAALREMAARLGVSLHI